MQFQIARAATELEAARLLVYNAARLRDAGQPFLTRSGDVQAVLVRGRRARCLAGGQPVWRLRIREGLPVEKLYRDAKIGQIYEGTSNLQLQTIAKQILG